MNKKVKARAEQAKQYAREQFNHPGDSRLFSAAVFQEKFAELVVKETMRVVADNTPSNVYLDVARAVIMHYED